MHYSLLACVCVSLCVRALNELMSYLSASNVAKGLVSSAVNKPSLGGWGGGGLISGNNQECSRGLIKGQEEAA